ncbi:hypothetical protein L6250_03055 [Candidatus Parcubacteria bacterium]|nr:hypothetical protein [Candidatus Parcubacteria bacterium]
MKFFTDVEIAMNYFLTKNNTMDSETEEQLKEEEVDEGIIELMKEYDLDQDTAERVQEIVDDWGVDVDDAIELEELL